MIISYGGEKKNDHDHGVLLEKKKLNEIKIINDDHKL